MRDALVVGAACLVAIGAGAWLFFAGESAPEARSGPVPFEVYVEGQDSGLITERKNYRIRSEDELDELWQLIYGTSGPIAPPVDFAHEELLAIFDGTHSSGGFAVAVSSLIDEAGVARRVEILHSVPGEECLTTQAISSPFIVIIVPKTELPLKRTDTTETLECN